MRRARPLLGTLVEIGVVDAAVARPILDAAVSAAFARIAAVQSCLSRFDATSEIARFNAAAAGTAIAVGVDAQGVLAAARALHDASDGVFDVSLGTGPNAWRCERGALHKLGAGVHLDLGGIAKGHAVDVAVETLIAAGVGAGWVNAGGDLRAFGAASVPIDLRDEDGGGVRRFGWLEDGAFATSRLAGADGTARHASVAAPLCLWADALTKIVVATADASAPVLARFGARAWLHARADAALEA